jgi:transcriptional regulator with XRE-family HTH domain
MITAAQCRSARTLLSWSVSKLARAALVSERTVDDFELERRETDPPTLEAIRRALEAVGIVFRHNDAFRPAAVSLCYGHSCPPRPKSA